jgi:hypothetical protein
MYPGDRPPHPRAGIALGLAILAAWVIALGAALATSEPAGETRPLSAPPAATR